MTDFADPWSIVLAAGDGKRLQSLTSDAGGVAIPKQFCSLYGGSTLLADALRRAHAVSPRERICTIVAAQHRRWWRGEVDDLSTANVFVQPENRGTANGILLSTLHVAARDAGAIVVLLPSDHHFQDEATLGDALRAAANLAREAAGGIVLLGIEPDEADPELGYIVPQLEVGPGLYAVRRFVEKPETSLAAGLIGRGALWNSFILAARVQALFGLFERRLPGIAERMRHALDRDGYGAHGGAALAAEYAEMRPLDFSRHLLAGAEADLLVKRVPACGWSDLGTPGRLATTLRRRPVPDTAMLAESGADRPCLAVRHARQGGAALAPPPL
ncbi:MAG TPA: sugar phosphate nucleotidyltransferase [Steroidobacteraceae bacterium]|nr:sugar phosphate nucleotidyltransferase [Steroidobacteraceae bacterium]